jgi:hypothetical protein
MRRRLLRLTIGRLLIAIAIVSPLSVAILGYATGFRCPLCFSGRVIPVHYNELGCGWEVSARRGDLILEYGPGDVGPHRWYCRTCELKW